MTIDERLDEMSRMEYPMKIDIVQQVMEKVEEKPYLITKHKRNNHWRIAAAAAAAVCLVAINVALFYPTNPDEENMSNMLAKLNDYSTWSSIEDGANPIEFMYDE